MNPSPSRIPPATLSATGKKHEIAPIAILEPGPTPNHMIMTGKKMIFAACGVTDGTLLKGVRFFGGGARTHTLLMTLESRKIRFIDAVHLERRPDLKVRF